MNTRKEIKVERRGTYQGVPQYGITGCAEITPSRKTAEKWAALENAARTRSGRTNRALQRCNQCEALMINGVFCHETGCPNTHSRYDTESGEWVKQRKCFDCGCTVDADDPCCSAPFEDEEEN